ncbi:MAG: MFS transporter, partial [Chloroflexota bacterium]
MSDQSLTVPRGARGLFRIEAFTIKGYRFLWSANLSWNIGRWMEQVAVGWLALQLTGSPLLVALIGFYRSLPLFLLGTFGGVLGDRYDRRRLMLSLQVVNVTTVGAMAVLYALGRLSYPDLAVCEVVMGTSMAFDWPSRRSLTVDLVGRGRITNAVAMDATGMNVSRTIGPLLSGFVIEIFSPGIALAMLAGLYLVNAALIWHVPTPATQLVAKGHGVWHNLIDGFG